MKKEMSSIDIAALGELLIDFTESGRGENGSRLFEQNAGGAPANLLTAASHMGYRTAFLGKIGTDIQGAFLKETLQREGIETRALVEDADYFTTLAFVELGETGERKFSFARKPGADTKLRKEELDKELLSNCRIFHFGSLSMTDEPARTATLEAIKIAKEAGAIISYDPNYRAPLWQEKETAIKTMKSVIPFTDMMKVSDEESMLLTETDEIEKAADRLLDMGTKLVAVTLGSEGVLAATRRGKRLVKAFQTHVVDTTGAGDSFWGGFLSCFLSMNKSIEELTQDEVEQCAVMGNAVAALCVQKRGGIPAIPSKNEVEEWMNR